MYEWTPTSEGGGRREVGGRQGREGGGLLLECAKLHRDPFGGIAWTVASVFSDHGAIPQILTLGVDSASAEQRKNTKRPWKGEVIGRAHYYAVNDLLCLFFIGWESSATFCFDFLSEKCALRLNCIPFLHPIFQPKRNQKFRCQLLVPLWLG